MKRKSSTSWIQMTADELSAATRAYDDPSYRPPSQTPPAGLKARHDKALAELRRSRGKSSQVLLNMEMRLLRRVDAFAKSHGMTRSQIVARGVRKVLAGT